MNSSIDLHYTRLKRHYDAAVKSYDDVSLLDLSHTLRIWGELKTVLGDYYPKVKSTITFKTAVPAKKVRKAIKNHKYIFSYLPDGVVTYASNGQLLNFPDNNKNEDFSTAISVKPSENGKMELKNYCLVSCALEEHLIHAMSSEEIKRLNYANWLGAEVVRVSFVNSEGKLQETAISREILIKRVANILDGSHPSVASQEELDNKFDEPIKHLLDYKVGGLSLPYFILLKIAQDIVEKMPKLMEIE